MKQEVKEKWLNALHSGGYKQGTHALQCDGKYCVLGVLCDIFAKEKNIEWENGEFFSQENKKSLLKEESILPEEVKIWAGLEQKNPLVKYQNSLHNIAELNDNIGLDFSDLAILIRLQL